MRCAIGNRTSCEYGNVRTDDLLFRPNVPTPMNEIGLTEHSDCSLKLS
jgi:hypothetical protein